MRRRRWLLVIISKLLLYLLVPLLHFLIIDQSPILPIRDIEFGDEVCCIFDLHQVRLCSGASSALRFERKGLFPIREELGVFFGIGKPNGDLGLLLAFQVGFPRVYDTSGLAGVAPSTT